MAYVHGHRQHTLSWHTYMVIANVHYHGIRTWSSPTYIIMAYVHGYRQRTLSWHTYMVIANVHYHGIRTWSSPTYIIVAYVHGHRQRTSWHTYMVIANIHLSWHTYMVIANVHYHGIRTWSSPTYIIMAYVYLCIRIPKIVYLLLKVHILEPYPPWVNITSKGYTMLDRAKRLCLLKVVPLAL